MPKVVSYLRVSTDAQDCSIEVQRGLCRRWFESAGLEGFEYGPELEDVAVSAKIDLFHRRNGQHLLTLLDRGDILVVAKLSRAFRCTSDALNSMTAFKQAGVRVVILDMNIDTDTPIGKFMLTVLAGVMELEREFIVERTREALAQRRKDGQWLSSHAPPGWRLITKNQRKRKDNELVIDDTERSLAMYALKEIASGVLVSDVATVMTKAMHESIHGEGAKRKSKLQEVPYFHPSRVLQFAVYAMLGFPKLTKQELKTEFGFDPFSRAFIVENYPSYVAGEFQPL